MITYEYDLDMTPGGVPATVRMSQYSQDVILKFNLYSRVGSLNIETGTTATIRGTKPDRNGISLECTLLDNVVTVETNVQMSAIAGKSTYEVTLHHNEKELSTANFVIIVEHAAMDKDTLTSKSVLRELTALENSEKLLEELERYESLQANIESLDKKVKELEKLIESGGGELPEKTLISISATFSSGNIIYTNSTLNDLKQYLVIEANYSDGTTETVTGYTLSGSLTAGNNTVTVTYLNKTTTFNVTVEQTDDEPEVEILAVFPDMYNTGCDNNYDTVIPDDVSGTINTIDGVKFAYSAGGLKLNCAGAVDGTIVEINNTDFCNNNITYIQAINSYITGDIETKDITFIFRNCNLPSVRATFGYNATVKSNIKYEFYDCTINDTISCENMKLDGCQVRLTTGDGIAVYLNAEIINCYVYEDYSTLLPEGHHLDIFQTIGYANYEGESLVIENCNFCLPFINNDVSNQASQNACLMIQPDYSPYNGVDIKSLYCNGGGNSIYLNPKKFLVNGMVEKIEVGCMYSINKIYSSISTGMTGVENIIDTPRCYVGTIKQNGDNTLIYATNYTNSERKLSIVTNNGTYTKMVHKCPNYDESVGSEYYTTFESLPFNVELSVPKCEWIKIYDNEVLIRDYSV